MLPLCAIKSPNEYQLFKYLKCWSNLQWYSATGLQSASLTLINIQRLSEPNHTRYVIVPLLYTLGKYKIYKKKFTLMLSVGFYSIAILALVSFTGRAQRVMHCSQVRPGSQSS